MSHKNMSRWLIQRPEGHDRSAEIGRIIVECIRGMIVYSTAGRDAKRVFAVVGITDDGSVTVADGKLRLLGSPKKKNLRHVRFTDDRVDLRGMNDEALAKYLESYESPKEQR